MCGIIAVVPKNGNHVKRINLEYAVSSMKHRGPDYQSLISNNKFGLGHCRLAIVDKTNNGNQPFSITSSEDALIYNGEIYNFKELRKELEREGIRFKSFSDTEVVFQALRKWGCNAINRFNGMFALVFWSEERGEFIIARDRYGIKPLYIFESENERIFASEIRAIKTYLKDSYSVGERVDTDALYDYLIFQNILSDKNLIKNIRTFPQGELIQLSEKDFFREIKTKKYWDWNFSLDNHDPNIEVIEKKLRDAVINQTIGEVNFGSFLSGGLDSSLIAKIASETIKPLNTFTIGFDFLKIGNIDDFSDEFDQAKRISEIIGTQHNSQLISESQMFNSIPVIAKILEDPRMGQSYPNYYACALASEKSTVVFSGAGGDELFGGYSWRYHNGENFASWEEFCKVHFTFRHRLIPKKDIHLLLKRGIDYGNPNRPFDVFRSYFDEFAYSELNHMEIKKAVMNYDAKTFLPGLLNIEDKLGMSFSIETRYPFLDNDLVDYILSTNIEDEHLSNSRLNPSEQKDKLILRKIASQYYPKEISNRKKQGFTGPDSEWFRSEHADKYFREMFLSDAKIWDYINKDFSKTIFIEHQKGINNRRHFIWSILFLKHWFDEN